MYTDVQKLCSAYQSNNVIEEFILVFHVINNLFGSSLPQSYIHYCILVIKEYVVLLKGDQNRLGLNKAYLLHGRPPNHNPSLLLIYQRSNFIVIPHIVSKYGSFGHTHILKWHTPYARKCDIKYSSSENYECDVIPHSKIHRFGK